jgi:hypothetical protein
MVVRPHLLLVPALMWGAAALVPDATRAEAVKPPAGASPPPDAAAATKGDRDKPSGHLAPATATPEIITDLSRLPAPVARTRERILTAARSGDLQALAALIEEKKSIFSFTDEKDPVAFWKENYPDSDGIEILSILVTILETPFVRLDEGTAQDIYVWPYFAGVPLKTLTPQQKVELFRIVTGADYKDMLAFGAYVFYRLGIAPDGTWHFFVAGD